MNRSSRLALTRRQFLHLSGAAVAGTLLNGCRSDADSVVSDSSEKIELVYQDWRTDWFPPMAREMLAEFHDMHPNIRVFYVPDPDNLPEKMLADMQAGIAPDVFSGCCDFFPVWAQAGYTLDLRPLVEAELDQETINDWDAAQYQAFFTHDGHQYALPKYHGALALYYNRDLFDEYRVDYPDESWTYLDYQAAMKRLTDDRDGDGRTDLWGSMIDISWDRLQVYANAWGGHFVDPENPTHCLMGQKEALEALQWIYDQMWQQKTMATFLDVNKMRTRDAFAAGRLAMVEDGSWALKDILSTTKFRLGVAPMPAGPVRRVTLATTDGFGIYAGTKHPEAAWELMKFLISKDYGRAMARANFLQPARASLVDEWVDFIRKEFPTQTREVDLAAFADGHLKGYSVTAEIFPNMAEATGLAYNIWDKVFTLNQAAVEEIATTCRQIEEAQSVTGN